MLKAGLDVDDNDESNDDVDDMAPDDKDGMGEDTTPEGVGDCSLEKEVGPGAE